MKAQLSWQLLALVLFVCQTNIGVKSLPKERIVNGLTAKAKQFPYQVFFDKHTNLTWKPACGGVIISERIILTAAHCFDSAFDAVRIYFGAVNISNAEEPGQQRLIVNRRNIIVHPEWNNAKLINDIALINLPTDLKFNEYIQPIRLPDPSETYENQVAVLSGWGWDKDIYGNLIETDVLQYYRQNILSEAICSQLTTVYYLEINFFSSSWICAETRFSSPCWGDSGGPMVVEGADGTKTLVGLSSFGSEWCDLNIPAIYTRVSSFLDWIINVGNLN